MFIGNGKKRLRHKRIVRWEAGKIQPPPFYEPIMKLHPIVPFRNPLDLATINLDHAEEEIHKALAACPNTLLTIRPRPQDIINDKKLFRGRKVMRERQEVKIEEIGNSL